MTQLLNISFLLCFPENLGPHLFFTRHIPYCPGDSFEPLLWDWLPAGQTMPIGPFLQTLESLFDISEQMPLVLEN